MDKNQKGISAVEGLLILIIVGILCGTGWYVWHSKQDADIILNGANKTSSAQPVPKNASLSSQQQYLEIKEWKIKLPLSKSISDAYYVVSSSSHGSNGEPNTVWLGLKSLDSKGCAAATANTGGPYPIGAILRINPKDTDPISGTPYTQLDPDGTTIGNYYYAYHSGIKGSTSCAQKSNIKNIETIDAEFKAAGRKIIAE